MFKLSFNLDIVKTGSLMGQDNLYLLETVATHSKSLKVESRGTKCKIDNNDSEALWHKYLGHIF